jgi:hypothetical protein
MWKCGNVGKEEVKKRKRGENGEDKNLILVKR